MSAICETGPVLPPRGAVHARAIEIERLARIAAECAMAGPACDLNRALGKLRQIAAIAGDAQ